jgi:hypothetical protein
MIAHAPRTLGYYASSHWLQGAAVFVVVGALAVGLLRALNDALERAERQVVELTLRNMRTGMQLAMGEAMMRQREGEIAAWAGSNPMRWLDSPPEGYRGECTAGESRDLSGGQWCFDRVGRQLVYRPRASDHLRVLAAGAALRCNQLRWHVARAPESAASGGFIGLRIEAATPCQWLVEGS